MEVEKPVLGKPPGMVIEWRVNTLEYSHEKVHDFHAEQNETPNIMEIVNLAAEHIPSINMKYNRTSSEPPESINPALHVK